MLVRLILVCAAAGVLLLASRQWSRRSVPHSTGVPQGLTLVTSATCAECVRAAKALDDAGANYALVDASECAAVGIRTMTVPLAVVGNSSGEAVMVRRGTSIASDASRLVAAAAGVHSV